MKKNVLLIVLSIGGVSLFAQQKATTKTAAKPAGIKPKAGSTAPAVLKTTQDSISYAIGLSVASFYKQFNVTNINSAVLTRAINDVNKNGKPLLNEQQVTAVMTNFIQKQKGEKALPNKKAGTAFLTANKNNPGVITLPSGLQYQVIKEGNGTKPALTDKVKVHYHGTLIDGKVFDSSVEKGQPIELSVSGVIPGWTEALQLMPVGSKWKLFIPSNLAYGDNETGSIQAGSTLIFDVELLDIVK
jgi:FKBP-type peptidyl-prolyl cis-trans isomerase FklB